MISSKTEFKNNWEHIDLFFIRETSQKQLKKYIFIKNEDPNEFAQRQLDLSKELINLAKPRIIVVINALASRLYKRMGFLDGDKLNQDRGCYFTLLNDRKVPTLLGGPVSGQRALDVESRKRLIWHVKKLVGFS